MPEWLISFFVHPVTLLMIGGGTGANARYWLGRYVAAWQQSRFGAVEFPWATFIINVSGSVILGFVAAGFLHQPDPLHPNTARRNWYLLLGTGFCGGFTTFSTFSYETFRLLEDGKLWAAVAYAGGSVLAGLLGVWLALKITDSQSPA